MKDKGTKTWYAGSDHFDLVENKQSVKHTQSVPRETTDGNKGAITYG